MSHVVPLMTDDHRACDGLFVDLESMVSAADWGGAKPAMQAFRRAMNRHFAMEEDILFPAFETATGSDRGPTAVMRMEHEQMRQILTDLDVALEARDDARALGLTETLMVLMQQHNMKEEQILYPMSDRMLPDAAAVAARMQAVPVEG